MAGSGDMKSIEQCLAFLCGICVVLILLIVGSCLVLIPKDHLLDRASIPATLLQIYDCNQTAVGNFHLNPSDGYGLNPYVMNISYNGCQMCDKCDYWSPPPTCCASFVNMSDAFLVDIYRNYSGIPHVGWNSYNGTGTYMTNDASDQHTTGWVLIGFACFLIIMMVCACVSLCHDDNEHRKLLANNQKV